MDVYNNKKWQSLDKNEVESDRYAPLLFNAPNPSLCKESKHLTDLKKEIGSLKQLIYILKIG